jgi:ABC-type sulfate transport system permease component
LDPIEGRIDFAFFTLAFVVSLWLAIDPRTFVHALSMRRKPPTIRETLFVRLIAILMCPVLGYYLIWHVWRVLRAY